MTQCIGILGRLLGHDYQARYSLGEPQRFKAEWCSADDMALLMETSKQKTYHGDVCTRCGNTINTPAPSGATTAGNTENLK